MKLSVKLKEVGKQIISLFFVLLIFYLIKSELSITIAMLGLIIISFVIKYEKGEWKVLLFGILLGILFELAGDIVYKLQNWQQTFLFGIPLWLPLMWGYGFIYIRRIGNILVK